MLEEAGEITSEQSRQMQVTTNKVGEKKKRKET